MEAVLTRVDFAQAVAEDAFAERAEIAFAGGMGFTAGHA
jgi:hypothetical protein